MYRTFNCGIGMVVIVPPDRADETIRLLLDRGEKASLIGEVRRGPAGVVIHE
jgi:phosphoribosylformylglycinamidine cyclo-ligase